jgi:hypothetical protein
MTNDAEALQRGQSESGCRCLAPVSTPMKDGLTLVERYFVGELKSHFGESRTSGRSFRTSGRSFRAFWGQRGWLGHFEDSLGRETTQASNQLLSLSHCTRRRRRRLNRGRIHGILGGMGEDLYLGRHIHERCHPSRPSLSFSRNLWRWTRAVFIPAAMATAIDLARSPLGPPRARLHSTPIIDTRSFLACACTWNVSAYKLARFWTQ